ncbi:MAG: hypothetical protein ACRDOK_16205 [Streptosporangiaceae bacterium]
MIRPGEAGVTWIPSSVFNAEDSTTKVYRTPTAVATSTADQATVTIYADQTRSPPRW